jgi:uncharacterized membrane protein YkvA (DUF1232 family)
VRVPGPPHGRRPSIHGSAATRAQAMRRAEQRSRPLTVLEFARDVILLVKDLAVDPRVPRVDKVIALAAVVYLVSPIDLVPDAIPVVGQIEDVGVAVLAVRRLLTGAGYDVIYELWRGSDEGFSLLLTLAGVQE